MDPAENIERAIADLHLTTRAETDKRILDDAFSALRGAVHVPQPTSSTGIWRTFFKSRVAIPAAAAAVILIASALLLNTMSKDATVEELSRTFSRAGNVCVSTFKSGQTTPYQQAWASNSLKMRLFKAGIGNQAQFSLWDIPNEVKMSMYMSVVQTEPLTEQVLGELEKSVTQLSDISPFSDIKDIPAQARWNRLSEAEVKPVIPGTNVYELVWTQQDSTSGVVLDMKWRIFVDARTRLPKRAESYAKTSSEQEYRLESFVIITYPSESEIQDIIRNIFGQRNNRSDDPEYRGTPGAER